jgi:hypothetical protein
VDDVREKLKMGGAAKIIKKTDKIGEDGFSSDGGESISSDLEIFSGMPRDQKSNNSI